MATKRRRSSIASCPPRWSTPRSPRRETQGARIGKIAAELGFPLMPWQQHVADVATEIDPKTGQLVYRAVGLTVPRQSGKTTLILALMVWRALLMGQRQVIVYAAQTRNDARKKWEDDQLPILDGSPFGPEDRSPFYRVRKTNGNEAVLWKPTGSRYGITSNTEKAGHGGTIDMAFIDEAFSQVDARLEQAFAPAMITRAQPQLWVVSTAGTPESVYFRDTVDAGRAAVEAGVTKDLAYFEWSAPEDDDPADPATWWGCMPALGHTVTEDAVRAEYEKMKTKKLVEFQRAFLNQWRDRDASDPVIEKAVWDALAVPAEELDLQDEGESKPRPVAIAIDVALEQRAAAIGLAGVRQDGDVQVDVADYRPGTGWVVARILELRDRWSPVSIALDPKGPAGSLLPALREAGIEPYLLDAAKQAQACGAFYTAAVGTPPDPDVEDDLGLPATLRHTADPDLDAALGGAKQRPLGDAWAWGRKHSATDICPLVAVTVAHHALAVHGSSAGDITANVW